MFFVVLALFVAAFSKPIHYNSEYPNANWMEKAMANIGNLTLQEITLPGTHDSGSYFLTDELIGEPQFLDEIVKIADDLDLPVGKIIDGWAQSQKSDFFGQFMDGIRYVDVRVVWDTSDSLWKTHHGPVVGNKVDVLLQNTQQFVQKYTNEVLIMELSHTDGQTKEQEKLLIDLIQEYLGEYLWPQSLGFQNISKMIEMGKNILLTLEFDNIPENIWPARTIINSYANSPVLATMEAYNVGEVLGWAAHSNYPNQLFKMSWTLTPNVETILEMVIPGYPHDLIELADIANSDLSNWFEREIVPRRLKYPIFGNILIIDDYGNSPIVEIVQRGLNGTL